MKLPNIFTIRGKERFVLEVTPIIDSDFDNNLYVDTYTLTYSDDTKEDISVGEWKEAETAALERILKNRIKKIFIYPTIVVAISIIIYVLTRTIF